MKRRAELTSTLRRGRSPSSAAPSSKPRVFLAGTVNSVASNPGVPSDQSYRQELGNLVVRHGGIVLDPMPPSGWDLAAADCQGTGLLFAPIFDLIHTCDIVVAEFWEPSMGTAVEMYEAARMNIPVVAVTSLGARWVVRDFASLCYSSLGEFEENLTNVGGVAALVNVIQRPGRS